MRLYEFVKKAGMRPYRELIQHHIRRQNAKQLMDASNGEAASLPDPIQPQVMSFIDVLNERLMVSKEFWHHATCREAVDAILEIANYHFDLDFDLPMSPERMSGLEQELAFGLFQIATLSFAYTAVEQQGAREFMGIRKGLLFR